MSDEKLLKSTLEEIFSKISCIENKFEDLKKTMESANDKFLAEVKSTVVNMNTNNKNLENRIQILENKRVELDKEDSLWKSVFWKKNNLIMYNLREKEDENLQQLEDSVMSIIRDKLSIDITIKEIDWIKRIGKKEKVVRNRPVLIKVISYRTKIEILRNCNKLRGLNISISEDFPVSVRQIRKELLFFKKKAQEKRKKAFLRYNKLIVEGQVFTLDELKLMQTASSSEVLSDESEKETNIGNGR